MPPQSHVVTISRFLVDAQRLHPEATGAFTSLLHDIALAAKLISREVTKAGLVDILGAAGRHSRSAIGVAALPRGAPVEVELTVALGAR